MNRLIKNKLKIILFFSILSTIFFIGFPTKTFAFDLLPFNIRPAYEVLENDTTIRQFWQLVLDFANGFVIIVLIAVAFTQILRININTYGVKKILPTLVLAVIAANFSYLFCRLMVDFANIIMDGIINSNGVSKDAMSNALNGGSAGGWASPDATHGLFYNMKDNLGTIFLFGIMQLLLIASGAILYILAFLFFIRLWMIYFLVPLAPLAIMSMVLPQTKSLFSQWWSNFSKWVFMPVVSIFWIWVGSKWLSLAGGHWFMQIIFAGVCFYLAITSPFKMGGAVMSAWGKLGKTAWGKTGGAAWNATGGAIGKGIKGGINNYWDTQKDHINRRMENTRIGKRVTGMRDKGKLNREIAKTMLEKQRSDSYRQVSLQRLYSKSKTEWDRQPEVHGRLKRIVGEGVNQEYANPAYRDEYQISDLEKKLIINRTTGRVASAYDYNDMSNLMHSDGTAVTAAEYGKNNGLTLFEESAASTKELLRREKITSRTDSGDAQALVAAWELAHKDTRVLGVSAVGTGGTGTPGAAGAAGQGGAGGQAGAGGQGGTAGASGQSGTGGQGGGSSARPPVRSVPEQLKNIVATAGDKADLIVERVTGNLDLGDLDISDLLTGDLASKAPEIRAQAIELGTMIDEEMESSGGKEKVENLDNGLFRIKEVMKQLGTGDIGAIEEALRSSMKPPIDLSLPGDKDDSYVSASTEERKISFDALEALEKIKKRTKGQTTLDPKTFDALGGSLLAEEVENQRSAVVLGTNVSQKTVSDVVTSSGNIPLENLDLDRVLQQLNRNLEALNSSVEEAAHGAANPLSELRSAGIGAIADRKALEDILKSSQSGLRDDLKGAQQAVFEKGYTGRDSLANPAVVRVFSDELTTRLVKRLSNAPLKTQVTNMPKSGNAGERASVAPTSAPAQPQPQAVPQPRPIQAPNPPAPASQNRPLQTAPPPNIPQKPPRPKI